MGLKSPQLNFLKLLTMESDSILYTTRSQPLVRTKTGTGVKVG